MLAPNMLIYANPVVKEKNPFQILQQKNQEKTSKPLTCFRPSFFIQLKDLRSFEEDISLSISDALKQKIVEFNSIKWHLLAKVIFERESDTFEKIPAYFGSSNYTKLREADMTERIAQAFSKIEEKIENFISNGSGWTLQNIEHIELKVAKYQPLLPSSYIRLPKHIEDKKSRTKYPKSRFKVLYMVFADP